jgi:hypothetical protein
VDVSQSDITLGTHRVRELGRLVDRRAVQRDLGGVHRRILALRRSRQRIGPLAPAVLVAPSL